jgi:alpha-tubulin suppressor-like RCC1 family protein
MSASSKAAALDLPLEVLADVCQHLNLHDLIAVVQTCKRFRHGNGRLETVEVPTKSPVVMALREHAFPRPELIPSSRPTGCSESWVAYLSRCVRQRRCREAPPIAAGYKHSVFVDPAGRLLACGMIAAGGDNNRVFSAPTLVAAMAAVRVRSVEACGLYSLALGWDGRVYSWGKNVFGQLGHGDKIDRLSPALVEGLEGVCGVAAAIDHSLAVTQSGAVFQCGASFLPGAQDALRPVIVEGFAGVRVRRVCAGDSVAVAIGGDGDLFSWGYGCYGRLGHGDTQHQSWPKRVDALRGIRMSIVAIGMYQALALTEDGRVYIWGEGELRAFLGESSGEGDLLPKPVEELRGVRVGSVAAAASRKYAVADTGEVWAWGLGLVNDTPLDHVQQSQCPLPKPIESLRGVKVDSVTAGCAHTLVRADDGSVYAWGSEQAATLGALGLGPSVRGAEVHAHAAAHLGTARGVRRAVMAAIVQERKKKGRDVVCRVSGARQERLGLGLGTRHRRVVDLVHLDLE